MKFRKPIAATSLALLLLGSSHTIARAPTLIKPIPDSMFRPIEVPPPPIYEPPEINNRTHPPIIQVDPVARVVVESTPAPKVGSSDGFLVDYNVSWYGPGFYGNRTACGYALTKGLKGVAHKSLPCGTQVTFRNPLNGRTFTVPVVDRGPYADGRQWDLTGGLCVALDHCYTGRIEYKIE